MTHADLSDAAGLAHAVRSGASAVDLTERALAAAAAQPGIVWALNEQRALADARGIDARVARGDLVGPLAGVPVAVKDTFDVAGLPASLGLPTSSQPAAADAEAVRRLRADDAIIIGKTAMDQLAWTMTGQAPGRPPCPNPAAAGALCGGSSGGSAAAVAAGIVSIALGTDTAGSIRVPAAWCSIVGYKPTRHLVSLAGCAPLAPNFDCIGVVTHSIGDCVLAARALGADISYAARGRRIRIGVPEEALEAEVEGFEALIENLATAGHHVRTVSLSLAARGYGRLLAAEFATAWADAVAPEDVSEEIRAGLHHGQTVAATAYLGVHGALATAERRARSVFDAVDVLALPTTPAGPPPVGTPVVVADVSRFTRVFSAYGWPAITLPTARGALQLVARPGADDVLLAIADALWPGRQSPSAVPEQSRLA